MHYLLRIMLEYYQEVKQNEYKKMVSFLDSVGLAKKTSLSYQEFCRIFDYNFGFLSLSEKTELFRRCYCLGNGKVSVEIIFAVFSQEGVFLRWVED